MDPSNPQLRDESPLSVYNYPSIVHLWLKFTSEGDWISTLSIPFEDFSDYTLRPLKWLRYLGFAIYGCQGVLKTSPDGPEVDDYLAGSEGLQENYYYSSPDPPRFVDVEGINDRTSDSLGHSHSSCDNFADQISTRDGTCVLTNAGRVLCNAAHLIPHSKGDAYIQRLTQTRGDVAEDRIDDINDPRNGLLLALSYHRELCYKWLAFLKTPNFCLLPEDVPSSPGSVPGPSGRLTLQYFVVPDPTLIASQNQDARPTGDLTSWPPSVITDVVYACAVVQKWGSEDSKKRLQQVTHNTYYNDGTLHRAASNKDRGIAQQTLDRQHRSEMRDLGNAPLPGSDENQVTGMNGMGSGQSRLRSQREKTDEIFDWILHLWSSHATPRGTQQQDQDLEDIKQKRVQEWLQT
ncbi:hypothetical protein Hypma_010471 [Hypsizygus marmoreus]|uniref:HNH nuclease domain-containing protein n=1 Tax=Hypsizygus marmoreus TaxID=39966 RepID=A0A369JLW0_HYPMA|nr:hypothetical protein Hypma_010471 [Hypsizygus marmoreus]